MNSQLEVIKKTSILIKEKKYVIAKKILLDFMKNSKNIKLDIKIYYNLYLISDGLHEFQNSKKYLEKCLRMNDKNYIVLNNLANIFLREGNIYKSEKFYLKSFNLKKNYLPVIINIAILYQNLGRLEESKIFYLKAIEIAPKQLSIYFNLSRIDPDFLDDKKIKFIYQLLKNEKFNLLETSYGYFLLAENERKKNNFNSEIKYLKKANKFSFESNKRINIQTLFYWTDIIINRCRNFEFLNNNSNKILENLEPIFIIGLPRSGSTVVEALLSVADEKIRSLGESSIFNGLIANSFSKEENNLINLDSFQNKILEIFENKNLNLSNKIYIDKSLENFFYIDVILKIFPKAKFINTTRNVEDNIFAIFKQSLNKISWSHSIDDILEYVNNYLIVIDHFSKKYPNKIFSMNLEKLSNNPKEFSKNLYTFCNLKWSDKVLNFHHKKDLFITTASNIQIRGNIEKYNIDKYKSYKSMLKNFSSKYKWLDQK